MYIIISRCNSLNRTYYAVHALSLRFLISGPTLVCFSPASGLGWGYSGHPNSGRPAPASKLRHSGPRIPVLGLASSQVRDEPACLRQAWIYTAPSERRRLAISRNLGRSNTMAYYRVDPSGGRPPTPHPFHSDPTWGTLEKPRRRRHSSPTERPGDYVYVLKRGSHRSPDRVYRRASHADRWRIHGDRPPYRRQGDIQWTERRSTYAGYRDDLIQRKIDAQNEEIAARPSENGTVRAAGTPSRAKGKRYGEI